MSPFTEMLIDGSPEFHNLQGTLLHKYVVEGDLGKLKQFIESISNVRFFRNIQLGLSKFDSINAYLNALARDTFRSNINALEIAIKFGHTEIFKYLLEIGVESRAQTMRSGCRFDSRGLERLLNQENLNDTIGQNYLVSVPHELRLSVSSPNYKAFLKAVFDTQPKFPREFKFQASVESEEFLYKMPLVFLLILLTQSDYKGEKLGFFADELQLDMNPRGLHRYPQHGDKNEGMTAVEFIVFNRDLRATSLNKYVDKFITKDNISESEIDLLLELADPKLIEILFRKQICGPSKLGVAMSALLKKCQSAPSVFQHLESNRLELEPYQINQALMLNSKEVNDYLFKHHFEETNKFAPYLVLTLFRQKNNTLNFLLQNLITFNQSTMRFEWGDVVGPECSVGNAVFIANKLFSNPLDDLEAYNQNLEKAKSIGLLAQENSPLIQALTEWLGRFGIKDQVISPVFNHFQGSSLKSFEHHESRTLTYALNSVCDQLANTSINDQNNQSKLNVKRRHSAP